MQSFPSPETYVSHVIYTVMYAGVHFLKIFRAYMNTQFPVVFTIIVSVCIKMKTDS